MKAPRASEGWTGWGVIDPEKPEGLFFDCGSLGGCVFAVYDVKEDAEAHAAVGRGHAVVIPVRIVPVIRGKASKGKRRKSK